LVMALDGACRLQIGRLGTYDFPRGHYVYVGSALGGLTGRLRHHLSTEKRLRWHIDYLLQSATLVEIWYALGRDRLECTWNKLVGNLEGAKRLVPGFGASDCCCPSHLTYFCTLPLFELFRNKVEEATGTIRLFRLAIPMPDTRCLAEHTNR
jgi:Uri superfamily endonuclease